MLVEVVDVSEGQAGLENGVRFVVQANRKLRATAHEIEDDPQTIDFTSFVNCHRRLVCNAPAISLVSALNFGAENGEEQWRSGSKPLCVH